jgi:hypothetical protein
MILQKRISYLLFESTTGEQVKWSPCSILVLQGHLIRMLVEYDVTSHGVCHGNVRRVFPWNKQAHDVFFPGKPFQESLAKYPTPLPRELQAYVMLMNKRTQALASTTNPLALFIASKKKKDKDGEELSKLEMLNILKAKLMEDMRQTMKDKRCVWLHTTDMSFWMENKYFKVFASLGKENKIIKKGDHLALTWAVELHEQMKAKITEYA